MESLKAILEKIEAPLVFSSKDSYKHLPLIKDFEGTMTTFLKQLKNELSMYAVQEDFVMTWGDTISGFEEAILDFDKKQLEELHIKISSNKISSAVEKTVKKVKK